jgi:hypothetical protein
MSALVLFLLQFCDIATIGNCPQGDLVATSGYIDQLTMKEEIY